MQSPRNPLAADAVKIFGAALDRVDPQALLRQTCSLEGSELVVRAGEQTARADLDRYETILVFGAGKASARMALGLEAILGDRIEGGTVVVKTGQLEKLERITLVEASHPLPDETSVAAAASLLELAARADEHCLCIGLTSGGASSLLCAPAAGTGAPALSLADKQETTRLLLASGAAIGEVNCVRKHLSAIKGGRLAAALAPARVLNLILSDVVGDDPGSIASGITAPDPTSFADALGVLERYALLYSVPPAVRLALEAGAGGRIAETPKPGDRVFARTENLILGSGRLALLAAGDKAKELGYGVLVLSSRLEGEAREAGILFAGLAEDIRAAALPLAPPACLLAGGETTVTLRGTGKGGRNQELALSFLTRFARPDDLEGICLLSAGTDGTDGPTDAAGAFACAQALEAAASRGFAARDYLSRNDSYTFFDATGHLFRIGPTNTNVGDVQILLVGAPGGGAPVGGAPRGGAARG